jgi:hypothetical protein
MITTLVLAFITLGDAPAAAPATCPMHAQHTSQKSGAIADPKHGEQVDQRHDTFGFSHAETRHSFRLFEDGGAIELRATVATDEKTVAMIRTHMKEIARSFAKGDFTMPHFVHGHAPDGVDDLAERHASITWKYEELPEGARVRMKTTDGRSLRAIHAFQRFQIVEHRTRDKGEVERP